MTNYAIMRFKKLKTRATCTSAINHIDRVSRVPFENENVKNLRFDIGNRPEKYIEFVKSRLDEGQKIRKDNVLGLEFVLAFTPGAIPYDKNSLVAWAKENMDWLAENFGSTQNIYKLTLHLHEKSPHLHAIVVPQYQGKLNCKHYIGGRDGMRKLQDSYAEKMSVFGLQRGISKEITKRYHKDVGTWQKEQIQEIDRQYEELEREKLTIQEQKEILDAVYELMHEDFDFRIQVHAKMGEMAVPEPDEILPKKKVRVQDQEYEERCR